MLAFDYAPAIYRDPYSLGDVYYYQQPQPVRRTFVPMTRTIIIERPVIPKVYSRILETDDIYQVQIKKSNNSRDFTNYSITYNVLGHDQVLLKISNDDENFSKAYRFNASDIDIENIEWKIVSNMLIINVPRVQYQPAQIVLTPSLLVVPEPIVHTVVYQEKPVQCSASQQCAKAASAQKEQIASAQQHEQQQKQEIQKEIEQAIEQQQQEFEAECSNCDNSCSNCADCHCESESVEQQQKEQPQKPEYAPTVSAEQQQKEQPQEPESTPTESADGDIEDVQPLQKEPQEITPEQSISRRSSTSSVGSKSPKLTKKVSIEEVQDEALE